MENLYSVASARDNLPRLLHEVEEGTLVKITRRGKPIAVLLGMKDYERLQAPPSFSTAYQEWRATWLEEIEECELQGLRDGDNGREVQL